ncbi:XdhC family protein [Ruegeria atlantica]|uniref:XdhC- CoxI domain-containing protein n=1 Tax=Ruegeria atlantica TaxID=81569 RepID=A0ABX1WGK1_9RHOB|nr:hypothetical protein [Ruegeria atlantica]
MGSRAVVSSSGRMIGYMSNGCIDRDIRLQVVSVLETGGTAKTI